MLKKGLVVTLATIALALARTAAYAEAPVITPPADIIIGDLEQGDANNVFIFADAVDLDANVTDDNTADNAIKWTYTSSDAKIAINGTAQLSGGDPNTPLPGEDIRQTNLDAPVGVEDGSPATITFRNTTLSPGFGSLGPYPDPGTTATGILPAETRQITLNASDGNTFSTVLFNVYTANNTSDSLSGGGITFTGDVDLDFENNANDRSGWFGAVLGGMGSTTVATGLCMTVPFGADPGSSVGWVSPPNFNPGPNFIQLVDKAVYKSTLTLFTNTTVDSGIPYCDWTWNNFILALGDGNSYGGLYWLLDVANGATGIGRFQTDFNVWITPNPALTDQWRGVVDSSNSAFDPSVDFKNDFSFTIRILHDNASIATASDGGTICLRRLHVEHTSIDNFTLTPVQTNPIQGYLNGGIFFRNPDDFGTASAGTFVIDNVNHVANMTLTGNPDSAGAQGLGARKQLLYFDQSQPAGNKQFYPQLWERGKLYVLKATVRSNVGGPTGTVEGTDPVDAILVDFAVPQSEVGEFNYSTKGSNANFLHAASPRLKATTGGITQTYVGFFEGTEPSHANSLGGGFADSDRLRSYIDFFNTGDQSPLGTNSDGLDAITVESVEVDTAN